MDSRRKSLPPLDTLVFFEAAVRAGSFSAAAAELYVSQAAVSKRVRQLEDWLGADLFERGARSLTLSPAGQQLAEPATMALDYLQTAIDRVKSPTSPSVRIAANSAVAVFWLFKRLKSFALSPAACPLETVTMDDPRDLLSADNDLSIIYANQLPDGWTGQPLMKEELAPVASPAGLARFRQDPHNMPLLDYRRHAPDWINWEVWLQRQPDSPLHSATKVMCQNYSHSIGQALDGAGIALASCSLLQDELTSGRLRRLQAAPLYTGYQYFLIWKQHDKRPELQALVQHLSPT
ncbi:Gcv operon activator [Tritonibacter multivorans]|uniref:Gcv operon activator n=1 Tax=Tritonibacter multivorans TaxID=928856 RepID=A0A0P1G7M3_9RHOB|nr:LysR substrate-binding domain-containing protein [Tritonibacter multivorans]MDA7421145.1 LysR substrate-binding domain-containing protein [Tritonibacter multivorans]CUH77634.1 Gcv operon activator [Tritonibacter multivorans]SFD34832.1 DNA-binding transcriptional regulator, LysR family [Tritonibacter multivorans]